jgi:hypothetical protein
MSSFSLIQINNDMSVLCSLLLISSISCLPGIDCARLSREAMFVALPRKVDTMLPRVSSQIGAVFCPAAKGFQCAVLFQLRWSCGGGTASINSRKRLPRFHAGHEHGH